METAICEKCNKAFPPGGTCRIAEYWPEVAKKLSSPLIHTNYEAFNQTLSQVNIYCSNDDWLFPYLDNPDLDIDSGVARRIAKLEGPSQRMLTHSKAILREAGLLEIERNDKGGKLEDVLPRLQDVEQVQIAAILVLPDVGGSFEHILPFLEAESWTIRYTAVQTLLFLQGKLEHVLPRLADQDERVRSIAVTVLAELGGRLEHLLPVLNDTHDIVRSEVVKNLARLGGRLEHLLPYLEDENHFVSIAAIKALPELGGNIEHLRPKLQDSLAIIRKVALQNLFKLGGTLEDIIPLLTDTDLIVRNIAFDELLTFVGACKDKAMLGEVVGLCQRLIAENKLADIKIASREILELIARRNIGAAMALFNSDDPELHTEGEARLKALDPSAIFIEEKATRPPSPQDVELDD